MRRRQRGLALVVVLWISLLLGLLAASYAFSVRTETRVTTGVRERAEARALAEGAAYFAGALVRAWAPEELPVQLNGLPVTWEFAGRKVILRAGAASGRIDINRAGRDLLASALLHAGAPVERADALADAIVDWRDRDDARSLNGAEAPDYAAAGFHPGPKDAEFDSVDELGQVLGMTPEVLERLRPLVTVYGGGGIDPRYAPKEVLLMLSGGDEVLADTLSAGDNADVTQRVPFDGYQTGGATNLHLDIEVPSPGGGRYRFSAVIAPNGPVPLLDWRE